jgi:hypothetical protein
VKTYILNSAQSIANYQYNGSSSSALQPPVNFIRSYYEDLNRHDIGAITPKWKNPPGNLSRLVKNVEWLKVNSLRQVYVDSASAKVEIDVDGKAIDRKLEKWSGIIEVEKVYGKWKISKMNLRGVKNKYTGRLKH